MFPISLPQFCLLLSSRHWGIFLYFGFLPQFCLLLPSACWNKYSVFQLFPQSISGGIQIIRDPVCHPLHRYVNRSAHYKHGKHKSNHRTDNREGQLHHEQHQCSFRKRHHNCKSKHITNHIRTDNCNHAFEHYHLPKLTHRHADCPKLCEFLSPQVEVACRRINDIQRAYTQNHDHKRQNIFDCADRCTKECSGIDCIWIRVISH